MFSHDVTKILETFYLLKNETSILHRGRVPKVHENYINSFSKKKCHEANGQFVIKNCMF